MPDPFCTLCGSTNPADLGDVIGICLDAAACHRRQYARLRARTEAAEAKVTAIAGIISGIGVRADPDRAYLMARDIRAVIGSEEPDHA